MTIRHLLERMLFCTRIVQVNITDIELRHPSKSEVPTDDPNYYAPHLRFQVDGKTHFVLLSSKADVAEHIKVALFRPRWRLFSGIEFPYAASMDAGETWEVVT